MNKILFLFILQIVFCGFCLARELENPPPFKVCRGFSYGIQQYTGLNFLSRFFTKTITKITLKHKTHAKKINVDLKTYCALDLLQKKMESINLNLSDLNIDEVPIKNIEVKTFNPIYFKKPHNKKRYRAVYPIDVKSYLRINLSDVNQIISNLPKWKKRFKKILVPIPPFGSTEIQISDFKININDAGIVNVLANIRSIAKPDSEPIKLNLLGKIAVEDKKINITNIETDIEGLFEKDSDESKTFSKILEELINPVINFNKFEKKDFKINDVILNFKPEILEIEFNLKLIPID